MPHLLNVLQHMDVLEELRQLQLLRKEQAREQAYLARLAQLDREREAQLAASRAAEGEEQDQEQPQQQPDNGHDQSDRNEQSDATTAAGEESGRKRRRQVIFRQSYHGFRLRQLLTFPFILTASGLSGVGQGVERGEVKSLWWKFKSA